MTKHANTALGGNTPNLHNFSRPLFQPLLRTCKRLQARGAALNRRRTKCRLHYSTFSNSSTARWFRKLLLTVSVGDFGSMMISTCSRDEVPDSDGDERPVDRGQAGHLGQSLQRTCPGVGPCGGSTLLSYICPCGGGGLIWWGGQQDSNKNVFC